MVKWRPLSEKIRRCNGGMAEWLKAHVLKTCLGHTNVGSNPTPSAIQFMMYNRDLEVKSEYGEVPEWLNGLAC
jgi:hypothetical protein